jgi:hypothetical protein
MTIKTENGPAVPIDLTDIPITVKITPIKKKPVEIDYDSTTPSSEIIRDSLNASGMNLLEFYVEKVAETFERSRNLVDEGGKLSIILPDFLDGGGLEFERIAKSTTKTTKKNIFQSP